MKCDWCDEEFEETNLNEVIVTRIGKTFRRWLCEECTKKWKAEEIDIMEKNEYYTFLDQLSNSGETNMFGARPYLQARFGMPKDEAIEIILTWMETFDKRYDNGRVSTKKLKVSSRTVIEFE